MSVAKEKKDYQDIESQLQRSEPISVQEVPVLRNLQTEYVLCRIVSDLPLVTHVDPTQFNFATRRQDLERAADVRRMNSCEKET